MALDYGERYIGLALSDDTGLIATSMKELVVGSTAEAIKRVHKIANSNGIEAIVIGLPLGSQGNETEESIRVRYFARALETTDKKEIIFWDETFSTQEALQNAKTLKKKHIHSESARIILQEYLDFQHDKNKKII